MRKSLLFALFALVACVAHAQFIGYVSPQTENQSLATSLLCTGSAQTFAISNLGQTQHWLSVSNVTGATQFQAEIDGIDRQGNVIRISDMIEPISNGLVYGSGSYAQLQAKITCSPNTATFTATYSGGWGTSNGNAGGYLSAQIDKQDFSAASAGSNQTDTFQTPFGSSAGTIFFKYNTSAPTGSTLAVQCTTTGGALNTTNAFTVTLAPLVAVQVFQIPETACPQVTVAYTSGGAAATFNTEYLFSVPGLPTHATSDPCDSGSLAKVNGVITAAAASTTQQIAAVTGSKIYVCGYQMSQIATAGTVQWVYGTGANCGTGTTNISGAMGVTASSPITYGGGSAVIIIVPTSNALCLTTTGAGGTVAGLLTFIQSP